MAEKRSSVPLALSFMGLVTCCAPLGLVGAFLGYRQGQAAKQAGEPFGGANGLAVGMGLLSTVLMTGLYFQYQKDQAEKGSQRDSAMARVSEADRAAETLSEATACTLAEVYLLDKVTSVPAPVSCPEPMRVEGTFATLPNVTLSTSTPELYTVCLARGERWFVTGVSASGSCPNSLPELAAGPTVDATEAAIQAAMPEHIAKADVQSFVAKMAGLQAGLEAELGEGCPPVNGQKLAVIDAALLPQGETLATPSAGWSFLSTEDLREALDGSRSAVDRAKSAMNVTKAAQYLLIVQAGERGLPKADGDSFEGGYFEGRAVLVDWSTGAPLCHAALAFENSETVNVGGGMDVGLKVGPKVNVGGTDLDDAIDEDFRKVYSTTLEATVAKMVEGKLKILR